MKVSLSWVRQYTKVDVSAEKLAQLATERLGGLESVTNLARRYEGIVAAKIISCEKHPDADKLHVCLIDDGGVIKDVERREDGYVQVVCGAPNAREGILVAWIPPGSVVPASYGEKELFVLEARELRGQLSNGMLASPRELGMNDEHEGILELDESEAQPGQAFVELFELDDTILDIENKMFTHRPDCFGQLGVAREIAGIQHQQFTSPEWYTGMTKLKSYPSEVMKQLTVKNEVNELCPRYTAVMIEDVEVKPSPLWLQSYLKRVGIKPINTVVDITNYIMMLTAQPLHAFDFDKIARNGVADISIRNPKKGETMSLLDGKTITPHSEAVLICNPDGPIALGGVMGGGNSEIDTSTKRIVLECATFDMYNVRKTSMKHGIFTDAATRLTKGQPAAQLGPALGKAIQLFKEVAGAHMTGDIADSNPAQDIMPVVVTLTSQFINERLGSSFTVDEVKNLLENVEFTVEVQGDELTITVPFWRTDIALKEDIVEEVGRLHGFNQLPMTLPQRSIKPAQPSDYLQLKKEIREILARAGANEVLTYSFVHGNLLEKAGQKTENSYKLRNALSPDLQYYRQTLTPSLLEQVHPNIKAGYSTFVLFELNKTHNKVHGIDAEGLPGELEMLSLTYASGDHADGSAYFMAKKYLEYVAENLGFTLVYKPTDETMDYPVTRPYDLQRSALVSIKETGDFLGIVGEYKQEVTKKFKLPNHSAGFEVGPETFLEARAKKTTQIYKPLSKFPGMERDLTIKVPSTVTYQEIAQSIESFTKDLQYKITFQAVSIYQKEPEFKNLTFRFQLLHPEQTMVAGEANKIIDDLSWLLHETHHAERV